MGATIFRLQCFIESSEAYPISILYQQTYCSLNYLEISPPEVCSTAMDVEHHQYLVAPEIKIFSVTQN
jgi:hypothetical protein